MTTGLHESRPQYINALPLNFQDLKPQDSRLKTRQDFKISSGILLKIAVPGHQYFKPSSRPLKVQDLNEPFARPQDFLETPKSPSFKREAAQDYKTVRKTSRLRTLQDFQAASKLKTVLKMSSLRWPRDASRRRKTRLQSFTRPHDFKLQDLCSRLGKTADRLETKTLYDFPLDFNTFSRRFKTHQYFKLSSRRLNASRAQEFNILQVLLETPQDFKPLQDAARFQAHLRHVET